MAPGDWFCVQCGRGLGTEQMKGGSPVTWGQGLACSVAFLGCKIKARLECMCEYWASALYRLSSGGVGSAAGPLGLTFSSKGVGVEDFPSCFERHFACWIATPPLHTTLHTPFEFVALGPWCVKEGGCPYGL